MALYSFVPARASVASHPQVREALDPSGESDPDFVEGDAGQRGRPYLARRDRRDACQRARRDDLAGGERRIDRVARQQLDEMAQGRERPPQDIGRLPLVNKLPSHSRSTVKVDSACSHSSSLPATGCHGPSKQGAVQRRRPPRHRGR